MKLLRPAIFCCFFLLTTMGSFAQLHWVKVDSLFQPLPQSVHVFFTNAELDGRPFRAYYIIADLKDKSLQFATDTTYKRRLTPAQFFEKNNEPLLVVNTTFFSFETNQNLNLVVKNGKTVGYNRATQALKGKDTLKYAHVFSSAIGIAKNRTADVVWTYTDSSLSKPLRMQCPVPPIIDSNEYLAPQAAIYQTALVQGHSGNLRKMLKKWKVQAAVGGGPVLVQNGNIVITNNEERRFAGKAINDKHPRTAMGYTSDHKLIILAIEGRNPGAAGASLTQEAAILKSIGCIEALNLDGGGSSCMLVNGKETIVPSDKKQRAVPAVFLVSWKNSGNK